MIDYQKPYNMRFSVSLTNDAEHFCSFFEHSDVLEAVFECISTSLADKTSISSAEKQENAVVCQWNS